jgi:hypothetical protein
MVTIDYNKSYRKGKILTDEITLEKIRGHFSEPIENIKFIRDRANNQKIPDTSYAIQPTGMFDFGLSESIIQTLYKEGIDWETTKEFDTRFECGYKFSNYSTGILSIYDDLNYKNRYYGIDTIRECLTRGYGTVVWATGAGKSFLQASLIENIWRVNKGSFKCLIIVPGLNLVSQLLENFEEYGVNFTYSGWTGGPKGLPLKNTEVVICNSENFCSKFSDNQKWIKKIADDARQFTLKQVAVTLGYSLLRFFIFGGFYAWLLVYSGLFSAETALTGVATIFLLQSFAPSMIVTDAGIRTALPLMVFSVSVAEQPLLLALALMNYFYSVLLPGLTGLIYILLKKAREI